MASAMIRPMVSSWLAEIVPTWAIIAPVTGCAWASSATTMAATARSIPILICPGLAPAATFFTPSR
jgi:hypothetical protein